MPTNNTPTPETLQVDDPRWLALQQADRRARRHPLTVTRGKNGMDQSQATRLTVDQALAYHTSALKNFELAVRSGKEADVLTRRLEVEAAVHDLVEAARFSQVIKDLRAAMHTLETRGTKVAPPAPPDHHETGG